MNRQTSFLSALLLNSNPAKRRCQRSTKAERIGYLKLLSAIFGRPVSELESRVAETGRQQTNSANS